MLHWLPTFQNFLTVLPGEGLDSLSILTNYISPRIFEYIEHYTTYEEAIAILKAQYVKPANEVFAQHLLATRRQKSGETIEMFFQALKSLSKDRNFQNITETEYRDEAVRDAFITGLQSNVTCQRLLENNTLDLNTIFTQARSLDAAQKSSESFSSPNLSPTSATALLQSTTSEDALDSTPAAIGGSKCYFCGCNKHPHQRCPPRKLLVISFINGYFAKVCRSNPASPQSGSSSAAAMCSTLVAAGSNSLSSLSKSSTKEVINGVGAKAPAALRVTFILLLWNL